MCYLSYIVQGVYITYVLNYLHGPQNCIHCRLVAWLAFIQQRVAFDTPSYVFLVLLEGTR